MWYLLCDWRRVNSLFKSIIMRNAEKFLENMCSQIQFILQI
jgi:hypothetical protein